MLEAKTNLSKLVYAVESGSEKEVVIARNGKPAAKLVAQAIAEPLYLVSRDPLIAPYDCPRIPWE
jgi:prevent-host-death family protein